MVNVACCTGSNFFAFYLKACFAVVAINHPDVPDGRLYLAAHNNFEKVQS